jgi:peptide deformylase
MARLPILRFPDPKLKLVAKPVEIFDQDLQKLCANLLETMYESEGIGLAATQAGVLQRVFVMDLSERKDQPLCFINPKIVAASDEITWEEGCLSFPGAYAYVKRNAKITVEYLNWQGEAQSLQAEGLNAVCIQHEIDHLDGVTFYDHLSPLKQKMMRKKLEKQYDRML